MIICHRQSLLFSAEAPHSRIRLIRTDVKSTEPSSGLTVYSESGQRGESLWSGDCVKSLAVFQISLFLDEIWFGNVSAFNLRTIDLCDEEGITDL